MTTYRRKPVPVEVWKADPTEMNWQPIETALENAI